MGGLWEAYFIADPDVAKDSNLEATLFARLLDLADDKLRSTSTAFPRHIRLHVDNATSEGKNNTMAQLLSLMVNRHHVATAKLSTFRVGHTHNNHDQRLSVVNTALTQADLLQTPTDFEEVVEDNVIATQHRPAHMEMVATTRGWAKLCGRMPTQ